MIPRPGLYEVVTPPEEIRSRLSQAILQDNPGMSVVYMHHRYEKGYNLHFDIQEIGFDEIGMNLEVISGVLLLDGDGAPGIDVKLKTGYPDHDGWIVSIEWS